MVKIPEAKKLPSGNWNIYMRLGGQSFSVTDSNKARCERKARETKEMYLNGEIDIDRDYSTLGELIDRYIDSKEGVVSPSTMRGYKAYRRDYFQKFMDIPVSKIDWQGLIDSEPTISSKTLVNAYGLVRASLKAMDIPEPKVILPKKKRSNTAWLSPEEIKIFISAMEGQIAEVPALLGLCSLRRSEIFGLTFSDYDATMREVSISKVLIATEYGYDMKDSTKTEESCRRVPVLIPRLAELLDIQKAEHNPEDKICAMYPDTAYKNITKICTENGLPLVGLHGLRRSFASLCYELKVPALVCMKIGGWANLQTVEEHYLKCSQEAIKRQTDALKNFFNSQ